MTHTEFIDGIETFLRETVGDNWSFQFDVDGGLDGHHLYMKIDVFPDAFPEENVDGDI